MGATILVDRLNDEAIRLIGALDEKGLKFPVALLASNPETNDWNLVFGIQSLKDSGGREIFKTIYETALRKKIDISLTDIQLLDTTDPFIVAIKSMISTGEGISTMRFTNNYFNGQKFPDSIVYRVN